MYTLFIWGFREIISSRKQENREIKNPRENNAVYGTENGGNSVSKTSKLKTNA